jgi:glycosyltransferase involved in cell wall biosynthesis
VIAYRGGGALETILDGRTGIFFDRQETDDLDAAILRFEQMRFNPEVIRKNAMRFDKSFFADKINAAIRSVEKPD